MNNYYKVLKRNKSCHGGDYTWSLPTQNPDGTYTPGNWHTYEGELCVCLAGFHLTNNPYRWYKELGTTYETEVDWSQDHLLCMDDKIVVRKIRLTKPLDGVVETESSKSWYRDGKLHKEDGPACEFADGTKHWCQNNLRHRTDGPTCEYADGTKYWCQNNLRHRTDGPACEDVNGNQEWYKDGELHRLDGPALEYADGTKQWWVNGKQLTETEFARSTSIHETF